MTKVLLSNLINTDDFKEVRSSLLLRNNSSGTEIVKSSLISIIELSDNSITLKLPLNSCQVSHFIDLFIFQYPLKKEIAHLPQRGGIRGALEVIGKVSAIMKIDAENDQVDGDRWSSVDIELTQYDVGKWERFVLQYVQIQERINNLSKVRNS